jgi:hypothetical protein
MPKKKVDLKEYFRHDYHARNHLKFKPLRMDMGMTGLGIYWSVVEILYEEGGTVDKSHYTSIAYDLRILENDLKKVIEGYNLFEVTENAFASKKVIARLKEREKKAKKAADSAKKKWDKFYANADKKPANALRTLSERSAKENSREEKSIVENSREENNNDRPIFKIDYVGAEAPTPPPVVLSIEDRRNRFYSTLVPFVDQFGKDMVRNFFEYWTEAGENQKKMRFEKEKAFDIKRRLSTWKRNEANFKTKSNTYERGKFVA